MAAPNYVTPRHPARVVTNSVGLLSIAQQSSGLAIPAVQINVPARMSPGESIAIRPNADVQADLKAVTGDTLMNGKRANGELLLSGRYHTQDTANALAQVVSSSMSLTEAAFRLPAPGTRHLDQRRPRPGVYVVGSPAVVGHHPARRLC